MDHPDHPVNWLHDAFNEEIQYDDMICKPPQVRAAPGEVHGDGAELFAAGVAAAGDDRQQGRHAQRRRPGRQRGARRRGLVRAGARSR